MHSLRPSDGNQSSLEVIRGHQMHSLRPSDGNQRHTLMLKDADG